VGNQPFDVVVRSGKAYFWKGKCTDNFSLDHRRPYFSCMLTAQIPLRYKRGCGFNVAEVGYEIDYLILVSSGLDMEEGNPWNYYV